MKYGLYRVLAGGFIFSLFSACTPYHTALNERANDQVSVKDESEIISESQPQKKVEMPGLSDAVRFVNQEMLLERQKTENCSFKRQVTCKSRAGFEKCEGWHMVKALRNGANTVLVVASKKKLVIADYYKCQKR